MNSIAVGTAAGLVTSAVCPALPAVTAGILVAVQAVVQRARVAAVPASVWRLPVARSGAVA